MTPRSAALWACLLSAITAAPSAAFDVLECDNLPELGTSGITTGWAQPTAAALNSVLLDDSGFAESGLSPAATLAGFNQAVENWNNITGSTLVSPTPVPTTLSETDFQTNFVFQNSDRIFYVIDSTTSFPAFPTTTGWSGAFPGFDIRFTLAIARTQIDNESQAIIESDIYFNDDLANQATPFFTTGEGDSVAGVDLVSVATHEYGHLLGAAHSAREEALMFPSLSSGVIKPQAVDDLNFVRFLYPSAPGAVPPDRNSLLFLDCFNLRPSGETIIAHQGSAGCSLVTGEAQRPLGAALLTLLSGLLLWLRRRR